MTLISSEYLQKVDSVKNRPYNIDKRRFTVLKKYPPLDIPVWADPS